MSAQLYRVSVKGGILSPSELLTVIDLARELGLDGLHFGSRQDILFPVREEQADLLQRYPRLTIESLAAKHHANIMCSYVAADIFPSTPWLTSSTYLYILEQFAFATPLEINLTDPRQRLVPLFTGHLNFVASDEEDFWYLYVKLPGWLRMETFPALIHSWDVGRVAGALCAAPDAENLDEVVLTAHENEDLNLRDVRKDLAITFKPFPYYEGMNRLDRDHYWLGLYWRNNWYSLDFMAAACELCLEQRIGKLSITPWKSFIVSGIPETGRLTWEKLLGRFGINARHSSLELNWHLPVADGDALELKRYLVREFDRRDISTYGLTFGVSRGRDVPFTSIVVEREELRSGLVDGFAVRPLYTLKCARNFDPNTREYAEYARRVDRSELAELMVEISQLYFEQLNEEQEEIIESRTAAQEPVPTRQLQQCGRCRSVYDPDYGEPASGIAAGTAFAGLPATYRCWTCGGGKEQFSAIVLAVPVGE
ncbi:rubredoxin [Neolewinella xylanilytica]|uniref:Rubredoxin n=1 Tax=Neolewinella xylanilytica TaxID=1514080 RepID=A0A2S6IA81_9BACT|nr:rubredoxin [Neolewinella xylanilytica]PPK88398.1 rubredoxin [Neolewinella xylanilytica]